MMEKLMDWVDSVRGLRAHVALYREMNRLYDGSPAALQALREQEGRVGHALLHVIGVFPIGSGRFL